MADIFNDPPFIDNMSSSGPVIDLRKVPITRVLIPFVAGTLTGLNLSLPTVSLVAPALALAGWTGLCILTFRGNMQRLCFHLLFAGLSFSGFLYVGTLNGGMAAPVDPGWPCGATVLVRGKVLTDAVTGQSGGRWEMQLEAVASHDTLCHTRGRVRVYAEPLSDLPVPSAGERWQLLGRLAPIAHAGNPGEPDYAAIMAKQGIWYRLFLEEGSGMNRELEVRSVAEGSVQRIRDFLSDHWSGEEASVSLLRAVCLGDRSGLTEELKAAYAGAGGMHLLAVSGLHVGLIWWVLQRIFGGAVRLFRKECFRALPTLVLLWFYAWLTGYSSSVSRAVTMLTLFTLARLLDRRSYPLNTILVSAMLMVAIDPGKVREVGFQLSYAAILGIVVLFPLLRKVTGKRITNRFFRWIWEATAISVAAQVATLPLVIFYFHQVPTYALLTNLLAIPVLSLLIALFVISIPCIWLEPLHSLLNRGMNLLAAGLNQLMESVAGLPGAVITGLHPDRMSLYLMILFVSLSVVLLKSRSRWCAYSLLLLAVLMLIRASLGTLRSGTLRELQVLHVQGGSMVIFRRGPWVDVYQLSGDSITNGRMERYREAAWGSPRFRARNMRICDSLPGIGGTSACVPVVPGIWLLGNGEVQGWLVSGTPGRDQLDGIRDEPGSFILLAGEPRVPTTVISEITDLTDVILDGSNRRWFVERQVVRHPSIHATADRGAYLKTW